ncbi:MAG: zinc ribbon domain-containing protein [Actinomycetes bacterium]
MAALDDLLALQALDTRLDQLEHQLATLPVRAEIEQAAARRASAESAAADVRSRLGDLRATQEHLESQAAEFEAKAVAADAALYDGSVTAHKDLEALQHEIAGFRQRQTNYEDQVLGVMEEVEPVEAELAAAEHVVSEIDGALATLDARLQAEAGDVLAELEQVRTERDTAVAGVPEDLLADYTPLRARLGGTAVARLVGARCEGCFMEIPSAQLEQVRRLPAETVATCPECGRMLVR